MSAKSDAIGIVYAAGADEWCRSNLGREPADVKRLWDEVLIRTAVQVHGDEEGGLSFDVVPGISRAHDGAWVSCWAWVGYPPAGETDALPHERCGVGCSV